MISKDMNWHARETFNRRPIVDTFDDRTCLERVRSYRGRSTGPIAGSPGVGWSNIRSERGTRQGRSRKLLGDMVSPLPQEMPVLDALYRRYHGQGLEMIGLSADRPHDRPEVRRSCSHLVIRRRCWTMPKSTIRHTQRAANDNCHRRPRNSSRRVDPRSNGGNRAESICRGAPVAPAKVGTALIRIIRQGKNGNVAGQIA